MAITERTVQNKRNSVGELTGKPGIVYDVNIKHKVNGQQKTHSKKGFATKKEALQYEAAMKNKLSNPSYVAPTAAQRKMTVEEYLEEWVERHGNANLRPSTKASYRSHIRNHVIPYIGSVPLGQVTPAMLDDMFRQLYEKGLSHSSVKYAHRVVGVAFEHARKYHYIENNPARDVITKFGKQGKTPDPYTTEQMSTLFANVAGSKWELIVVLGGLYGLRLSEILGLRWRNIDLESKTFAVVEQLPFGIPAGTVTIDEMAPVKSSDRVLPITDLTLPYFQRQLALQAEQRTLLTGAGQACYDNDLVIAKPNGAPERRERVRERDEADSKYQKEYPLMEWGWSRKDCIQAIRDAGLPLPGKSSCFFCPSMKRWEIRTLYHRYPDLLRRALAIEDAAMPNLTSVRGLGRNWAWRDFICADENQLAIPGAFSDEDLPCSCCMKGELPTADL